MGASVAGEVAVVGGGRWGRILCDVLSRFEQVETVHLVARRNPGEVRDWLSGKDFGRRVVLHDSLDAVADDPAVVAALIANLPAEHYATAQRLLDRGKHLLVEKPFVETQVEARALIALAEARDLVLAVGLEYLLATYVHYFKRVVAGHAAARRALLTWHDVRREQRWGMLKRPDVTTHVVADLMPHALSLLTVVLGRCPVSTGKVISPDGGLTARIELACGACPVEVSLSRVAAEPRRALEVQTADGRRLVLDFTREPGTVTLDGRPLPPDDLWDTLPRPLTCEIADFLGGIERGSRSSPLLARETLHIVEATEAAALRAREEQSALMRRELAENYPYMPAPAATVILQQHLALPLLEAGFIASLRDDAGLARWTALAFRLMHKLACHPFATQLGLSRELGLPRATLARLNGVLRASDFVQDLILRQGQAAKYWHNTIIPLVRSGSIGAALAGAYRYPFRIGVYPGASCMFSCTFCGRNTAARYEPGSIPAGNERLKAMFRSAPRDDPHTFYISGGLEPLTNPGIGDVVSHGAALGYKLSMYTNGYVLTPRLLERQAGLWDLATLRISCYGVDAATAAAVTRKDTAFEQMLRNAKDFLRLRNERGSALQFGFNFVILPGCSEQVLRLAEVIAEVNRNGGGRPVDFLTLREDYSARGAAAISGDERARMVDIFSRLEARVREPDLRGLQVDYGYALHAIRLGKAGRALEMADGGEIRRRAYPQVSVVVDLLGDVYLYREAGFLERPGAARYIIGRIGPGRPLERIVADFVESGAGIEPRPEDTQYFDIFDHVVTKLLNLADADAAFGIPWGQGPVRGLDAGTADAPDARLTVAHPTLAHPTLPAETRP